MIKKNIKRKGYAVIHRDGRFLVAHPTEKGARGDKWLFDEKVIPCTISYQLPLPTKRIKKC